MADGSITVEVSTQAAQAELERLRAENAALKHDLQYARGGLTKGRTRMREDNDRLAREAHTWSKAAETYAVDAERLRAALGEVLAWGTDENYERAKVACDTARALLGPNVI
jgi:FtsZ-binding cell division protein ZapB